MQQLERKNKDAIFKMSQVLSWIHYICS